MRISWMEFIGTITIIAGLVGFTFAGSAEVRNIAQAVFYVAAACFFFFLFRRFVHRKPKGLSS
jgi:uncharacterized membrane protein YtjA (UPF0391 family)